MENIPVCHRPCIIDAGDAESDVRGDECGHWGDTDPMSLVTFIPR